MKRGICLAATLLIVSSGTFDRVSAAARNGREEQEQQFRQQQQEARRAQEQALRAQEDEARRRQQEQQRAAAAQEQRAEQQRAAAAQEQRAEQQRAAQEQRAEQQRAAQEQRAEQQREARQEQSEQQREAQQQLSVQEREAQQERTQQVREAKQQHEMEVQQEKQQRAMQAAEQHQSREKASSNNPELRRAEIPHELGVWQKPPIAVPNFVRPSTPRALNITPVPLQKAAAVPMFDQALISAEEREHAQRLMLNLQQHLCPIPMAQAPSNYNVWPQQNLDYYVNNYKTYCNDQPLFITRENTFVNPVPVSDYPYWYQPEPGWVYSNGFTLGNMIRAGLDWLGFGWHPYYGPTPSGFMCAANYMPTPYTYYPAYGLWRVAGTNGWAQGGPPFDYSGPISVEVIEPRRVAIADPITGWRHSRYINVPYLYNAFYYPEFDRWGYANRHKYFVWLNV